MSSSPVDPHFLERSETRRLFYSNYKPNYAFVYETDKGIVDEEGRTTYWPWVLHNSNSARVIRSSEEEIRAKRLAYYDKPKSGGTRKRAQRRSRYTSQRAAR